MSARSAGITRSVPLRSTPPGTTRAILTRRSYVARSLRPGRHSILVMVAPHPVPPFTPDGHLGVPLRRGHEPARVVVIRLHAFGDTAITFPVLAALRRRLPLAKIDVVTDIRSGALVKAHRDVDEVIPFDTRQPKFAKGAALLAVAFALRRRAVPAVLDLQRNRWSQLLTRL